MYKWTWKDDYGIYINDARSLEEIIEEVLEYYFGDYEINWLTEDENEYYEVIFRVKSEQRRITSSKNICDVSQLLNQIASYDGRNDYFSISEIN